jgi:hypothetical protein
MTQLLQVVCERVMHGKSGGKLERMVFIRSAIRFRNQLAVVVIQTFTCEDVPRSQAHGGTALRLRESRAAFYKRSPTASACPLNLILPHAPPHTTVSVVSLCPPTSSSYLHSSALLTPLVGHPRLTHRPAHHHPPPIPLARRTSSMAANEKFPTPKPYGAPVPPPLRTTTRSALGLRHHLSL